MINLNWLEAYVGSIDDCVEYANRLSWNLTVFKGSDLNWYVKSGESVIFSSDSRETVDSFLYGLGLAYAEIPDDLLNDLESELRKRFV